MFFAKVNLRFSANRPNTFLSTIVLFFRRRVRLIRTVRPNSVLFLVVFRQFRRSCRDSSAFVLWQFRTLSLLLGLVIRFRVLVGASRECSGAFYRFSGLAMRLSEVVPRASYVVSNDVTFCSAIASFTEFHN